jgi:Ca-activated chloride channel homolog
MRALSERVYNRFSIIPPLKFFQHFKFLLQKHGTESWVEVNKEHFPGVSVVAFDDVLNYLFENFFAERIEKVKHAVFPLHFVFCSVLMIKFKIRTWKFFSDNLNILFGVVEKFFCDLNAPYSSESALGRNNHCFSFACPIINEGPGPEFFVNKAQHLFQHIVTCPLVMKKSRVLARCKGFPFKAFYAFGMRFVSPVKGDLVSQQPERMCKPAVPDRIEKGDRVMNKSFQPLNLNTLCALMQHCCVIKVILKPMQSKPKYFYLSVLLFVFFISGTFAQAPAKKTIRILFVFDASNSMKTQFKGKSRMDFAKEIFYKFIDSLSKNKNYEFALRIYGSTVKYPPGDCSDSKLVVPFGKNNTTLIKEKVKATKPTGITPIEHSLTMAANDFPDAKAHNMILLITDGIEECSGDPCAAREKLMEKGIIIKPYIIGIGLTKAEEQTFNCIGEVFSGTDPNLEDSLMPYLKAQRLNRTTAQVNLLDISSRPTETDVNMSFFEQKSGRMICNYVHAMNEKGNPDTILTLRDGITYKIVVHTIPPVEKKDIVVVAGKHNIIPIDAPRGQIQLTWAEPKNYLTKIDAKMRAIIRKGSEMNTLHVQNISSAEKYIVGTYDLEVLTLPRTIIKDVKVNQGIVKNIEIPLPGLVSLELPDPGEGSILKEEDGKLVLVTNLDKNKVNQLYKLQPGNYRVEFRARSLKLTIFSIEKKFTVESEKEYSIRLY